METVRFRRKKTHLILDTQYQRPIDYELVEKIVREWDPDLIKGKRAKMSGHKKWSEIKHKGSADRVAEHKKILEKTYNRPWWKLVRWWDRKKHGKT